MTITAKVIADSIHMHGGPRLTTLQLRYPRFIHAEFMTHRVFSRNASSSRAIPVARLIADIEADPAMPIHWGKNQPGMQAHEEHNGPVAAPWCNGQMTREGAWLNAMDGAIKMAKLFDEAGYHKQIVNRLLEPYSHINVVVSSTKWENFFALRAHPDAQPEIRALAEAMLEAMRASEPVGLHHGEWHLPYVTDEEQDELAIEHHPRVATELAKKVSAARCARVSYLTFEGKSPVIEADLKLFDKLAGGVPLHASPLEHQATPRLPHSGWAYPCGNFHGWAQFRKEFDNEDAEFDI